MKINIEGTPTEIAELVRQLQARREKVDLSVKNYVPIPKTFKTVEERGEIDGFTDRRN